MSETTQVNDAELTFARALNEAICETADAGITESRAFASAVTVSEKMKPFIAELTRLQQSNAALVENISAIIDSTVLQPDEKVLNVKLTLVEFLVKPALAQSAERI